MYRIPRQVLVYLYRRRADGKPEYLLLKRRAAVAGMGLWQGVSGAPEGDETDEEAAIREVVEETGLDASDHLEPIGFRYELRWHEDDPAAWERIYGPGVDAVPEEVYTAEVPHEWEPVLAASEHETYRWCSLAEAFELLKYENYKDALSALDESLAR